MKNLKDNLNAVLYARVSREDSEGGISTSITNQIDGLTSYANNHGFTIVDICIDDGYSGSNFDRPSFKKMIQHINEGTANAVIVKDLSRFGRNFLGVSSYIDEFFKNENIRFVCINENYDSATDEEEFSIVLRNFLNALYLKEFKRKTKEAIERKKRKESLTPFSIYGLNKIDGKFYPDPETAPIIRRIFNEAASGVGICEIVRGLNRDGIKTPGELREERGICGYINNNKQVNKLWELQTVNEFLRRREYIGDTVNNKKNRKTPVILENTHEAIIDRELFFKVQVIRNNKPQRDYKKEEDNLLDIIFAGNDYRVHINSDRYLCNRVTKTSISLKYVKNTLYNHAKLVMQKALTDRESLVNEMIEKINKRQGVKDVSKLEKELLSIDDAFFILFEDYAEHKIDKSEYEDHTSKIKIRRNEIVKEIASIKQKESNYMLKKRINAFIDSLINSSQQKDKNTLIRCCVKKCCIHKLEKGRYEIEIFERL